MHTLFGISEDHTENDLSIDELLIKNRTSTFFFEASSRAMEPLILEKDILIVDRSLEFSNNKIIVAAINGDFLFRQLIKIDQQIELKALNPSWPDIHINQDSDLVIFGTVIAVARKLN